MALSVDTILNAIIIVIKTIFFIFGSGLMRLRF